MIPSGLAIAATIVTVLAVLAIALPLRQATPPAERGFLLLLALVLLPMNALAFHALRMPLDAALGHLMNRHESAYQFLTTFYAPLTEEPAKLWPLLIPWFRMRIVRGNAVRVALAIGLGFGLGEAWHLAFMLGKIPAIAVQPWHLLGGYIGERLMVCVMHAGFTYAALYLILRGKPGAAAIGILLAIALHWLANFPIYLAHLNPWGLSRDAWTLLLSAWVLFACLAMGIFLARAAFGSSWLEALFRGTMTCPGCGVTYRRPFFRFNLCLKSYERCPTCRKWHLVDAVTCGNHQQS